MRTFIKRTLLLGAVLAGVSITALVVTGYLACQEPRFYAELRGQHALTAADETQARQIAESFEQWARTSKSRQRASQRSSDDANAATYDPSLDTHTVRLTEKQLNVQLASRNVGSLSAPRVQLLQDEMRVGVEIGSKDSRYVFSADLQPTVNSDGKLRLDVQGSRLGKVPLPMRWLLSLLARGQDLSTDEAELDLSGDTPVFIVDLTRGKSRSVSVKSIQCVEGEIAIEFQASVVEKNRQSERVSRQRKNNSQR